MCVILSVDHVKATNPIGFIIFIDKEIYIFLVKTYGYFGDGTRLSWDNYLLQEQVISYIEQLHPRTGKGRRFG